MAPISSRFDQVPNDLPVFVDCDRIELVAWSRFGELSYLMMIRKLNGRGSLR